MTSLTTVAVITGAVSGIGRATTDVCREAGFDVVAVSSSFARPSVACVCR